MKNRTKQQSKDSYFCQVCGHKKLLRYLFKNARFCFWCFRNTNTDIKLTVSDKISIRESTKIRHKGQGFKKFISEWLSGWFPSRDSKLKNGVNMIRGIDKKNNFYEHIVKDAKTGKIIHEEHETLTAHNLKKYGNKNQTTK